MMRHRNTTKSGTPAGVMKQVWALVCTGVFWVIVPQVWAQGDVGSAECREVQEEVQQAVGNETNPPYRNHGQYVRAAAQAANPALEAGEITEACHACIVRQFAESVPIADQEACGPDVPVCDFGGTGGCCPGETCIATDVCQAGGICFNCPCPGGCPIPCP
jgi:hypothetical protein